MPGYNMHVVLTECQMWYFILFQPPPPPPPNGLAPSRRQAIIWTNAYPIHPRIYAVLGGDEF